MEILILVTFVGFSVVASFLYGILRSVKEIAKNLRTKRTVVSFRDELRDALKEVQRAVEKA